MPMAEYHMNRKEKEIKDQNGIVEVLRGGKHVTVALCRQNEPYVVTMNYGYDEKGNSLYFHCGLKGLELDLIKQNSNVCATIIEDQGYKTGECDQAYRSVVFWGKMHAVHDLQEKQHGMGILLNHLEDDPGPIRERSLKSDQAYRKMGILRLDVERITGKQGQ